MRQGIVVYLADGGRLPEGLDPERWLRDKGVFDPDWIALAGPASGYPPVAEALRILAQRGARAVDAVPAWFEPGRGLRLGGRRYRLWGPAGIRNGCSPHSHVKGGTS